MCLNMLVFSLSVCVLHCDDLLSSERFGDLGVVGFGGITNVRR
jgi:hypothetical protein